MVCPFFSLLFKCATQDLNLAQLLSYLQWPVKLVSLVALLLSLFLVAQALLAVVGQSGEDGVVLEFDVGIAVVYDGTRC